MNKIFEVNNLSKDYNDAAGFNVHLLEDVSFNLEANKITTILAPVGAGKSSLLRILSGLEFATTGSVKINSPNKSIIYIPSNPSTFPWFSVLENIQLVNRDKHLVQEIIEEVGLEGYENHYPDNNSLGFRFRISLGRAIAAKADVIVLDEPFSKNIKPETLVRMYQLILSLREKKGLTFLFGTSNLTESILLSDKIFLMQKNPGKIISSLDIQFDQERDSELIISKKFIEYRNQIEEKMKTHKSQTLSNITV